MKKQILSEEFSRMQKLAGIITENESKNFDMTKAKAGDIAPWGEMIRNFPYGLLSSGKLELSTLKYWEAQSIANALKAAGFDAEALQVRGEYHDGFVHIVNLPKAHDDIIKMAEIIEDELGHILVNSSGKRVSKTGRL